MGGAPQGAPRQEPRAPPRPRCARPPLLFHLDRPHGGVAVKRNGATALALSGVVLGMVGLSFAAVPLYRLFCQATGFGGTTQRAEAAPGASAGPLITVRFNTETANE